ncbi:hypothetical protein [Aquicella lusitana]|uniref:Winged helix DNA-binding protein n=1 Tax=Aquicella lusitana TaxID=254246 RepID=A0A370H257_9COXI|nr:hypothetical protein [Aquicella lusitana]RDI48143.1 hypothetical protein C8D86_103108 [Aquicella lusitana]VVC72841.1 hypothetical protein AQULUS_05650 [Aquicella lusitana]
MELNLSLSLICFGIYLILTPLLLRLTRNISPSMLVCGHALLIYIFALGLIAIKGLSINFFSFSSFYWFLTLSFLMIFGAIYKSISLRMMLHLLKKPDYTDEYNEILKNYIRNQSYQNRIDILIEKEWIEKYDDVSFKLTKNGQRFARKLLMMQQLFYIKESG